MVIKVKEEHIDLEVGNMEHLCIQCNSHYMNGDDKWCSHHDKCCDDIKECDYFEEFVEPF